MGSCLAGMGKSTVGKMFVKHGIVLLDADQVSRHDQWKIFFSKYSRVFQTQALVFEHVGLARKSDSCVESSPTIGVVPQYS
jgi:dephospho-CoA kinase